MFLDDILNRTKGCDNLSLRYPSPASPFLARFSLSIYFFLSKHLALPLIKKKESQTCHTLIEKF